MDKEESNEMKFVKDLDIAETKGSMSSMQLREIEKNKIACAQHLFEKLSTEDIVYGQIDNYDKLISLVK